MQPILVTGGAGFIGCHLVRALLDRGHPVRVLDILERPGHRDDLPRGLDPRAEFQHGDLRRPDDLARALDGVRWVLHLAATGGFTSALAPYLDVNATGTARLLEAIRARSGAVERVLVASSVAVYGEGAGRCPEHGIVHPGPRPLERLARGQFEPVCPRCGVETRPAPTAEDLPVAPERPYSIGKYAAERLVLSAASEIGYDAAALRYFVTYGPGQSLTNPYTGVISNFARRAAAGRAPIVYEDGRQTRDFIYVSDLVDAHLVLLDGDRLGGRVFNAGSGQPIALGDLAVAVARAVGGSLAPELPGRYRLGDVRHVVADASALGALGWRPRVALAEGLSRVAAWLKGQPPAAETQEAAERELHADGLVRDLKA